ncbi:hypothetical protein BBK36DRAFT_1139755 [Trichoderma citrinoviride]|uniref:Uncharacterized protein n=1 Tax=Trichoderma citrinoviride TaxID=58853 RepID=A0A2T4BG10_9HYPO|nr:hypothetical protein BBK36DRAFT_1139755 [Trichoderma citrinoviride]PTB68257.1 hypothetical protein BBK36DRAFT_1139755 [Trichoderma citrinoviride]
MYGIGPASQERLRERPTRPDTKDISMAAWICVILPQKIVNYRAKSTDGLSIFFLVTMKAVEPSARVKQMKMREACKQRELLAKHGMKGRSFQGVKKGQQEAPSMAYDLWQSTPSSPEGRESRGHYQVEDKEGWVLQQCLPLSEAISGGGPS